MFDYLIAIGVAVVGLVVMYFMFSSISSADVSIAARASAERKPRSKKQVKGPSRRYKEDVLDQETEQLIAEEVARNPSGLSRDTKSVEPKTLEEVRGNRERESRRAVQAKSAKDDTVTERQRLIDRELGFQSVGKKEKKERKEKAVEPQYNAEDEEEMDRKLANFFRNSKGRNRQMKLSLEEESPASGTGTGGRVAIKGDLTHARSWQ